MALIDLNCDLGEGAGHDAELLALVTTANVACGAHAGDPQTMFKMMIDAFGLGVRVGAHPGFFDREYFGRRELPQTKDEVWTSCVYQIGAASAIAELCGGEITHVKAHGGLYNLAARKSEVALGIMIAAEWFGLPVLGLPGTEHEQVGGSFVPEGFADRGYRPDGTLVPRDQPGAFIETADAAVAQAERLIETRGIRSLCVHGDNPKALAFVAALRGRLTARGHRIEAFA